MKNLLWKALPILACAAAVTWADPLPLGYDNAWHGQYQLMQSAGEYFNSAAVASQDESVLITGYYENTDQYKVYVNGNLSLTTPAVPGAAIDYGDNSATYTDPSSAYGSGLFSTGKFDVLQGDVITIQDIGPLFPNTAQNTGIPEFDAQVALHAVPESGTAGLLLLGAAAIGLYGGKALLKV